MEENNVSYGWQAANKPSSTGVPRTNILHAILHTLELAMVSTMNSLHSPRIWELGVGDVFRGRTIAAVQGVVGFAHNPVAIIFFSEADGCPVRVPAAYRENLQHCDEIMLRARHWVRVHGLKEGDAVDLGLLRSEVQRTP